jgi:phospholipid-binding lipoprotein MlaA
MAGSMIRKLLRAVPRSFPVAAAMMCILSPPSAQAETTAALERLNHRVFELNQALMRHIVQPALAAYQSQVPVPAQQTVRAVYGNLLEPVTATAYALLGDINGVAASTTRFAVNSTVGMLGMFDVAGGMGFPKQEMGFSEAVCTAGLPVGSYVVLPVIGPTTTGIAIAGATLMVGSTYALSFLSLELALASVGIDMIGMGAALQNTIQSETPTGSAYDAERQHFFDGLAKACGQSKFRFRP